jgi:hypothetical protein
MRLVAMTEGTVVTTMHAGELDTRLVTTTQGAVLTTVRAGELDTRLVTTTHGTVLTTVRAGRLDMRPLTTTRHTFMPELAIWNHLQLRIVLFMFPSCLRRPSARRRCFRTSSAPASS